MPNVVLEYMAAALPVIVTDLPGIRELVEDGESGYVVPCGDLEAMERAARALVEDGERRRRMGRRGRGILESGRFTLEAERQAVAALVAEAADPAA